MLIPIAPAGPGEKPESPLGNMLRRHARPGMWLGISLRVADLPAADAWLSAKGFTPRYDPGMENHYFLIQPTSDDSPLARHCRDVQGTYCITFKVRTAAAAADYLRGKGFDLTGNIETRFAIVPEQAHGRLIYFTDKTVAAYPPVGSMLVHPAEFPA